MNTTLSTVTASRPVTSDTDLFGFELAARPVGGHVTAIVSKKDETKQLGRRITFDALSLAEFKARLASDKTLNSKQKKERRQMFLNADAIKQRRMLGLAALQAAYEPDDFAPKGRVPDVMELRKNGSLKLISVESFVGPDKTETPTQKIARLERELREARASKAEAKAEAEAPEVEVVNQDDLADEIWKLQHPGE